MKKSGFEFVKDLFNATRNHKLFNKIIIPPELADYTLKLYERYNQPLKLVIPEGELIKSNKNKSDKAIFTFSGGKDSLATFIKYKEQFQSFECFYILGITPFLKEEEYKRANNLAQKLNVQLKTINLEISNKTSLLESVIKNQMIYALIMEKYEKLPLAIGFGGTQELGPQSMCFYHDTNESFQLFHKFSSISWGEHKILPFLKDEVEAYDIIMSKNSSLENSISSCMTPIEKKEEVRKEIETKFKVSLSNDFQCGACYKCAEEKIILHKYHGKELSKEYEKFCKAIIMDKCVFEEHNLNGLIAHKYLKKLGIETTLELID
jgi:hypothetical protein